VINEAAIRRRFETVSPYLDERQRRVFATSEALVAGWGGISAVSRVTGIARSTIGRGLEELASGEAPNGRVRRAGAGRKLLEEADPGLIEDLDRIVAPTQRGDPEQPLRWTIKSLRQIARSLRDLGHCISHTSVGAVLRACGYSLQANRKSREGSHHPDRNTQFEYINRTVNAAMAEGQPAISVDAKKKELVGDFKNAGRTWRPKGQPEAVRSHDFLIPALGKAVPYGVYDIGANSGWVSVGIDHDTAAFAVNAIRSWWREMGKARYCPASYLVITADSGGSNSARNRLWKTELQRLADEIGLKLIIRHLPPGTSKWNRIEPRLFSFITGNWRGQPLVTHQVIIELIAATRTDAGLTVRCRLDQAAYPKGITVTDDELAAVNITRCDFHGEWNYAIAPKAMKLLEPSLRQSQS
jgi:Rhodopirellula transposase DDE domain